MINQAKVTFLAVVFLLFIGFTLKRLGNSAGPAPVPALAEKKKIIKKIFDLKTGKLKSETLESSDIVPVPALPAAAGERKENRIRVMSNYALNSYGLGYEKRIVGDVFAGVYINKNEFGFSMGMDF